ncbi:Low affinity potassium transport system protein kup [Gemmatirosa kalamazoonensis]|uniref:Probable potassium transport system protein Kup n=1 Tax=Gemmatirosa kalamazoonensis TaxID=861299 RepID=W0RFS8_9BACT|nr:potassium transporter Kup [Gemmatirosa kalamazoonensis]AHG89964.1 Low affinity potassium transport system protein kup [Gemmatirosa kalamazoonensis]
MTTPSPSRGLTPSVIAEPAATTAETPASSHPHHHADANPTGRRLALLTLTALGVVFGDIGTSPLYTLQECFSREHGVPATIPDVYGVLSLIVLSLTMIVTIKYVTFIMRADNKGEGGILALLALIMQRRRRDDDKGSRFVLISLALFGAALLYGDGIITPAISVLGAVDGLKVIAPALDRWVIIITIVILFGLFSFQRSGTERVGRMFGPVMLVWFATLAVLGVAGFRHHPEILKAVWPGYGVSFFFRHGLHGFLILGSVVLAVTGAEALYADMGHFGKKPIRLAWLTFVFPCLLLNYFGQGALLIAHPEAAANPFYLLAPRALQIPLLVIATFAAIVASQALISGAFSLTQQAVQLGFVPRLDIRHTSHHAAGQIYIPEVNQALALGCIVVVLFFKSATALGAAYGIAVTGTMAITTLLFHVIAREQWGWSPWKATAASATFLLIDLAFFGANVLKIEQGGWVPLAIGVALFTIMRTWKEGRRLLWTILQGRTLPMSMFIEDVARKKPMRVNGTAVFLTSHSEGAPVVLLHHLKHNQVLHEQVVLLSIGVADVPDVDERETLVVEELGEGFFRVRATYGFMQQPNVPDLMKHLNARGVKTRPMATSYYLGREQLIPSGPGKMARWRKMLFIFLSRNARSATQFFSIPPNRVVELGTQIEF